MDSELSTLYAKVVELEKERDAALELAECAAVKLRESRTEVDHYRKLWQHAEKMRKEPIMIIPPPHKKKRTVSDWIWTGIFVGAAAAVVYVLGWVLVWPNGD